MRVHMVWRRQHQLLANLMLLCLLCVLLWVPLLLQRVARVRQVWHLLLCWVSSRGALLYWVAGWGCLAVCLLVAIGSGLCRVGVVGLHVQALLSLVQSCTDARGDCRHRDECSKIGGYWCVYCEGY